MKKIIVWTAVMLVATTLLTSCSLNPLVGTWSTTIGGDDGQLILNRRGVGQVVSNGVARDCTWSAKDGKLTVVQDVAGIPYVFLDEVSYELEDGILTVTSQNGNTLVFEKK